MRIILVNMVRDRAYTEILHLLQNCLKSWCFLSEFQVFKESIQDKDGWITETIVRLPPSTEYDIRLRAVNQRPEMPNHSEYVSIKAKTKGKNKD